MSVVEYRRALHRIPELDAALPETCAFVTKKLSGLRCRLLNPIRGSVCAFFDAGRSDAIAFRADMDALPLTEETGLPYASEHPGRMHACGHDGHTAMLLALAEYLDKQLSDGGNDLPKNVLLIFQPAEETTGGAKAICESGVLERLRVRVIYGLHLWPELEEGTVWSRPGPLMARSNELDVEIQGRGAHLSRPQDGLDALQAGVTYLQRAYAMMEQLPPSEPRVLRFGKMLSGDVRNAISGHTRLEGSLRTYTERTFRFCRQRLEEIGRTLAAETGCTVQVHLSEGYPAVWNHEDLYASLCTKLGGAAPQTLEAPVLASEDFSYYQQYVPGIFCFLGVGDSGQLHTPAFHFDDASVLPKGVSFLQKLVHLN